MVVGESKRAANSIMEGIENTGDVRLHDHRLRLKQRFDIVRKLGQGTYGKVQLGINKKTGQEVAIKTIKKCKIETEADLVRIRREVQIMSSVRHPNIVHIYEVFENSEKMILVMEYCSGGELYDYLSQQKVLPEEEARRLFRQIATAVYYCHKHKICHRDLKLENVLLDDNGSAKIADFGLSNVFEERRLLSTFCGSPLYASPEIVKGTPYIGPEVDCWSLGVLLYTLVYGAMPFDGSNFKRLVRQISNGDYFEPKNPSTASPLIRDMLTVDPIQRADITHICDHPWVNQSWEISCLELAEVLANETPVRLDLLLSLAPPPPQGADKLLVADASAGGSAEGQDPARSGSVASVMDASSSAERRILELVAEGGTDAIKPSPTRTLVSSSTMTTLGASAATLPSVASTILGDPPKRKLQPAASTDSTPAPHRKKEKPTKNSCINLKQSSLDLPSGPLEPSDAIMDNAAAAVIPEQVKQDSPPSTRSGAQSPVEKNSLSKSSTMTVEPKNAIAAKKDEPVEDAAAKKEPSKPKSTVKKKISPKSSDDKVGNEKAKTETTETLPSRKSPSKETKRVQDTVEKLHGMSIAPPVQVAPTTTATPAEPSSPPTQQPAKPKKVIIPGVSVGSFKEQFERRASLTSPPTDVKKNVVPKKVTSPSKVLRQKAQSEDREIQPSTNEIGGVRLQNIGVEPPRAENDTATAPKTEVKKGPSKPLHKSESCKESSNKQDALSGSLSLEDARKNLQTSMALLTQARSESSSTASSGGNEEGPRQKQLRAARDIIANAIGEEQAGRPRIHRACMGAKPPVPYGAGGRSSSATVNLSSLASPPPTPPVQSATTPRTFRTEVQHRVDDVRNRFRGSSVERIIPIQIPSEETAPVAASGVQKAATQPTHQRTNSVPFRLSSLSRGNTVESDTESWTPTTPTPSTRGEPIKKSPREFIIPIAVEGKGYVTPRQGSLEPEASVGGNSMSNKSSATSFTSRFGKPRRISLVSGGESEEEDDMHMHRLRSARRRRTDAEKESVSSGEEDDDEGFELLTAENLFSTLLDRVRALTNRLNGEEGTGFSPHHQSLFNNLHSPFFNRREGPSWRHGTGRDLHADFDSMFQNRPTFPRGGRMSKKTSNTTTAPPNDTINDDTLPRDETSESLDLTDLDFGSIQLSEREMKTLSCLTPALSRRLQKQLLAHLPPAAARTLRRTLSMHNPHLAERPHYARSHSASKSVDQEPSADLDLSSAGSDRTDHSDMSAVNIDKSEISTTSVKQKSNWTTDIRSPLPTIEDVQSKDDSLQNVDNMSASRFSTLPRPKRRLSRNSDNLSVDSGKTNDNLSDYSVATSGPVSQRESLTPLRMGSVRSTPDRSVLSKYFTPDRTTPTEETYRMLSPEPPTSLLSEPSYIAAYGGPVGSGIPLTGSLRKRSLRLPTENSPRRRVSRFLRPDFFDTPREESVYAREKKDREIETQKVLKEIREKRNHSSDRGCISPRSPISPLGVNENKLFMDVNERHSYMNTLSPTSGVLQRDRSRSITPFSPILDNINEASYDLNYNRNNLNNTNSTTSDQTGLRNNPPVRNGHIIDNINNNENIVENNNTISNLELDDTDTIQNKASSPPKNSRLARPKSFPNRNSEPTLPVDVKDGLTEVDDKKTKKEDSITRSSVGRESKIMRPKSYPATTPSPEKTFPRPTPQADIATADFTSDLVVRKKISKDEKNEENKDDNGNITVTFNVNLPAKTKRSNSTPAQEVVCDDISEKTEKKKVVKKKVVKKKIVTQKSAENAGEVSNADDTKTKALPEKKKVIHKKEEPNSGETTTNTKKVTVKKKSVLQSLGQKFEKLRGDSVPKSNSPDKEKIDAQTNSVATVTNESKNEKEIIQVKEKPTLMKLPEPTTESGLITRAITENNLDNNETSTSNKKSVSRVLGLFKKFESKEKGPVKSKSKSPEDNKNIQEIGSKDMQETNKNEDKPPLDKPKRPTSLLLNGFGRKTQSKYVGAASDSALNNTLDIESKSLPNGSIKQLEGDEVKLPKKNLKLDVSKLPRINQNLFPKKDTTEDSKSREDKISNEERNSNVEPIVDGAHDTSSKDDQLSGDSFRDAKHELSHSSEVSPSMEEVNWSPDYDSSKFVGRMEVPTQPSDHASHHPHRNHEPTTPDHEDVEERIRRKSFYSRFNEKKQRRKSSLVGPGAKEYDPALRIQIPAPIDSAAKYEASPTSPLKYDISPTFNIDRLKALQSDFISPSSTKHLTSSLDNYRSLDRSDIYRSLDRSDIRKSPLPHKYTSLETTSPAYSIPRYNRTVSLFDDGDTSKGNRQLDSKFNKTFSMYSPGNYATYSPRGRTRNSAIILKEEKELSPENVLVRIRERKKAAMEAKESKQLNLDSQTRSNDAYKSKSDGTECSEKTN